MYKSLFFALLILAGTALAAAAALAGSNNANDSSGKAVTNSCPPANWTTLDLDSDGYATKDEVEKAASCIDFDAVDTSGDGSISRVEFLNFQEARTKRHSQSGTEKGSGNDGSQNSDKAAGDHCPPSQWNALDLSQDGYATEDEVKKAAPCIDFDAVDTNGDGSISRVEFLNFQEAATKGQSQNGSENGPGNDASQKSDKAAGGECPPNQWTALDLSQDGYANEDEVKKVAPCIDFDAVDTNGDGSISRVEFLDIHEAEAQGASESAASPKEAQKNKEQQPAQEQAETSGKKTGQSQYDTPMALVTNTPKGELKNPFDPHNKAIAKQGHQLFLNHGCSGCHGGGGGGGMGPPLTDQTWSYGDKPDTLYRLVTLGSKKLQADYGYSRNVMQTIQAGMPSLGPTFDNTEDLWKIITWVESKHLQN